MSPVEVSWSAAQVPHSSIVHDLVVGPTAFWMSLQPVHINSASQPSQFFSHARQAEPLDSTWAVFARLRGFRSVLEQHAYSAGGAFGKVPVVERHCRIGARCGVQGAKIAGCQPDIVTVLQGHARYWNAAAGRLPSCGFQQLHIARRKCNTGLGNYCIRALGPAEHDVTLGTPQLRSVRLGQGNQHRRDNIHLC